MTSSQLDCEANLLPGYFGYQEVARHVELRKKTQTAMTPPKRRRLGSVNTGLIGWLFAFGFLVLVASGCQDMPYPQWNQLKALERKLALQKNSGPLRNEIEDFERTFHLLQYEFVLREANSPLFRDTELLAEKIDRLLLEGERILITIGEKKRSAIEEQRAEIVTISEFLDIEDSKVLMPNLRDRLASIQFKLALAETYLECGEVGFSEDLLEEIRLSSAHVRGLMNSVKDRFGDPALGRQWAKWCRAAFEKSRNDRRPSLLIVKYVRQAWVLRKGKVTDRFGIDLGWRGLFDKLQKGDGGTPEGHYKVIAKKKGTQTKYYRALLLDYPNPQDRVVFEQAVEKGKLRPGANIGGQIEIHANGGRGQDWTEGCVALTDSEMDVLFRMAYEGMPVTIVGRCEEESLR
jgi:L,D-peptidoglycan transpeptidase YkuD (ErfK/YbiS/YcfS/YnhG family)